MTDSNCKQCFFYDKSSRCCGYYLRTRKHKTGSGSECSIQIPARLFSSVSFRNNGINDAKRKRILCTIEDGRVIDIYPIALGNPPLEFIGGQYIPADIDMFYIRSAVPLNDISF